MAGTVTAFADLGIDAWHEGVLPDALLLLSARLDLAGAGTLLDQLMATCWGPDRHDCPHCALKKPPDPHPKPPAPPPRPPSEPRPNPSDDGGLW